MIKHVVMWTVKEDVDKKSVTQEIKKRLESLTGKIEGMTSLEVGINEKPGPESFDVCLTTTHVSWDALQLYQDHPLHREVASYIGQVRKSRAATDFTQFI